MTTIHHSEVSPVPGVPKWRGEGGERELPFPHAVLSFTHFYQAPGTLVTDPLTLRRLGRRRHSPTTQATAKATSANHHQRDKNWRYWAWTWNRHKKMGTRSLLNYLFHYSSSWIKDKVLKTWQVNRAMAINWKTLSLKCMLFTATCNQISFNIDHKSFFLQISDQLLPNNEHLA